MPSHRQIDLAGRPSAEVIAAKARENTGPRLLAIERRGTADVLGYCGLVPGGSGSTHEPELAYQLLRAAHGCGYATEAGGGVVR